MTKFPFALIGFDLDGTMVDSCADLAAALNHALSLIDRGPLTTEQVRGMIGLGTRNLLTQGLAATGGAEGVDFEALLTEQLDFYEHHIAVNTRPYAGLVSALDHLDNLGVRYAVATNKLEHLAHKLLDELGLLSRMAAVIGGDTLGAGRAKPKPDMLHAMIEASGGGRTAFVGDTIFDIQAAAAAHVPNIVVDFGVQPAPVADLGADHVIRHFDELVPLLASLEEAHAR